MIFQFAAFLSFLLLIFCPVAVAGQKVSFESVAEDAIAHSHELKAAEYDYQIKKNNVEQESLSRFPEVSLSVNSVFSEQLKDKDSYFFSDDNAFSSDNQRYGNTLSFDLSYVVFDYDQRKKKHNLSIIEEKIARIVKFETIQKLKLQILSLYSQARAFSTEIKLQQDKLKIYNEMIKNLEKKARSGISSELDLIVRQKKRLDIERDVLILNQQYMQVLADLMFLTGKNYSPDITEFVELDNADTVFLEFDPQSQPELLIREQELEMKKTQQEIIKAEFFPKLNFKANYKYYGSDPDRYGRSLENVNDESYYAGLFTSVALIKSYKNYYAYKSGKQEIKKAETLLAEKRAELKNQFQKYRNEYYFLLKRLSLDKENLSLIDKKLKMLDRLENERLIDREQLLEQKIALIDEKINTRKDIITKSSAIKRLEIIAEKGERRTEKGNRRTEKGGWIGGE